MSQAQVHDGFQTIPALNPFRYRGYYYDAETGFYYLQNEEEDDSPEYADQFAESLTEASGETVVVIPVYCGQCSVNCCSFCGNLVHGHKDIAVVFF